METKDLVVEQILSLEDFENVDESLMKTISENPEYLRIFNEYKELSTLVSSSVPSPEKDGVTLHDAVMKRVKDGDVAPRYMPMGKIKFPVATAAASFAVIIAAALILKNGGYMNLDLSSEDFALHSGQPVTEVEFDATKTETELSQGITENEGYSSSSTVGDTEVLEDSNNDAPSSGDSRTETEAADEIANEDEAVSAEDAQTNETAADSASAESAVTSDNTVTSPGKMDTVVFSGNSGNSGNSGTRKPSGNTGTTDSSDKTASDNGTRLPASDTSGSAGGTANNQSATGFGSDVNYASPSDFVSGSSSKGSGASAAAPEGNDNPPQTDTTPDKSDGENDGNAGYKEDSVKNGIGSSSDNDDDAASSSTGSGGSSFPGFRPPSISNADIGTVGGGTVGSDDKENPDNTDESDPAKGNETDNPEGGSTGEGEDIETSESEGESAGEGEDIETNEGDGDTTDETDSESKNGVVVTPEDVEDVIEEDQDPEIVVRLEFVKQIVPEDQIFSYEKAVMFGKDNYVDWFNSIKDKPNFVELYTFENLEAFCNGK